MGAILQHTRFRNRHVDQLADQEEEASGFEKKGEPIPISERASANMTCSTTVMMDEVLPAEEEQSTQSVITRSLMITCCNSGFVSIGECFHITAEVCSLNTCISVKCFQRKESHHVLGASR